MFYSHTYLSKKGPLGTVWIAAFLQHKLRKSHVVIIDIPSSVERIMFPEAPIALRLSANLLVGIVRIYSRKVDYLYHDCNEFLTQIRTAFASVQVNLPEGASHAPFDSVTRPETFELDALSVEGVMYYEEIPDKHIRSVEDITIEDQMSVERNPYVSITLDEDEMRLSLSREHLGTARYQPMETDVFPPFIGDFDSTILEDDPSTRGDQPNTMFSGDRFSNEVPEVEVLRDFVPSEPGGPGHQFVYHMEEDGPGGNTPREKGNFSPSPQRVLASEGEPVLVHSTPRIGSVEHAVLDLGALSGHAGSELKLLSTPQSEKKKKTIQKRKHLFDRSLVLTNKYMDEQLKDSSKLLRKRRRLPCTALDAWRFHYMTSKDQLFSEPLVTGMCTNLQEAFNKSIDVYSVEDPAPTNFFVGQTSNEAANATYGMEEIEVLRSQVDVSHGFVQVDQLQFQVEGAFPEVVSPPRANDSTLFSAGRMQSLTQSQKFGSAEVLPIPDLVLADTIADINDASTVRSEGNISLWEDINLPEILDTLKSAESDALNFVEEPDSGNSGCEENDVGSLSTRTRVVAQYLIKKSPVAESSDFQPGKLSLNMILDGKTRKQSARIFFETLVLQSNRLINVHQEEAYGDITLSLNATILKGKF